MCFGISLLIDTIGRVGTIPNSADSAYYAVRQVETSPDQSEIKEGETCDENVF